MLCSGVKIAIWKCLAHANAVMSRNNVFHDRHARDSVQWFSELILVLTQVNAGNKLCIPPFSLTLFEAHNRL